MRLFILITITFSLTSALASKMSFIDVNKNELTKIRADLEKQKTEMEKVQFIRDQVTGLENDLRLMKMCKEGLSQRTAKKYDCDKIEVRMVVRYKRITSRGIPDHSCDRKIDPACALVIGRFEDKELPFSDSLKSEISDYALHLTRSGQNLGEKVLQFYVREEVYKDLPEDERPKFSAEDLYPVEKDISKVWDLKRNCWRGVLKLEEQLKSGQDQLLSQEKEQEQEQVKKLVSQARTQKKQAEAQRLAARARMLEAARRATDEVIRKSNEAALARAKAAQAAMARSATQGMR